MKTAENPRTSALTVAVMLVILLALLLLPCGAYAAEHAWTEIPADRWASVTAVEVPALKRKAVTIVALPSADARPLVATSAEIQPPGLYEIRLTLRPSHVDGEVVWNGGLRIGVGDAVAAEFPGQFFSRPYQPETRLAQVIQPKEGPLTLMLKAFADVPLAAPERNQPKQNVAKPPKPSDDLDDLVGPDAAGLDINLEEDSPASGTSGTSLHYIVDKVEFRPLSRSGRVESVEIDRLRYLPGTTLKGTAVLADIGGKGGDGTLDIWLEHGVKDRVKVKSLPVTLKGEPQRLAFEIPLPQEEFGYALVAEFVSASGADRSEAAEYFTIARNFQRVAIFGADLGENRNAVQDEATIRQAAAANRKDYYNAHAFPWWAPDDVFDLTPEADAWSAGASNYRHHKQTIQRQIRIAHELGIAVVAHGQWKATGYAGLRTIYDRPADFLEAYAAPVGSAFHSNTDIFDLLRNGEAGPLLPRPPAAGLWFTTWWKPAHTPVEYPPDHTPAVMRLAAEEMAASVDMFGWDGIRWEAYPRDGGSGPYDTRAARRTQALLRYFKEIVAQRHPEFRYAYNALGIEQNKGYEWAKENVEFDELARSGSLLMNPGLGSTGGWTFGELARNLQVDGDLCRERGAFYLGISTAESPRDCLVESALWAAAGCRPFKRLHYHEDELRPASAPDWGVNRETRRFLTRYAQYTLDERLRRLTTPEKVLAPQAATRLWWQPFVYETPLKNGKRQIVVNLLNLPQQDKRPGGDGMRSLQVFQRSLQVSQGVRPDDPLRISDPKTPFATNMPPGTDPVAFALTLPAGLRATAASLIDPQTLAVQPLPVADGRFEVPPVAAWSVVVVDLDADADAPSLGDLYGPPRTLGEKRADLAEDQRRPEVVLDTQQDPVQAARSLAPLLPQPEANREAEQAAFDALPAAEQLSALKSRRAAMNLEKDYPTWWKVLEEDRKREAAPVAHGDLAAQRNGRWDIFVGRGVLDQRLRLNEAVAGLERFSTHEALLWTWLRHWGRGQMENNVPWQRLKDFDLLVFAGIPYGALGLENGFALPDYVKAGGGVLFTGGPWGFGHGGYPMTVVEREVLPVLCTGLDDVRVSRQAVAMAPGPDFVELGVKADFSRKPSFWVWNEVLLKEQPGVKVFLTSARGPVLVGWQVGKGRVACLLTDYRGASDAQATAFFDWPEWPGLLRGVLRWCAPEAMRDAGERGPNPAECARLLAQLLPTKQEDEEDLFDILADDSEGLPRATSKGGSKGTEKSKDKGKDGVDEARGQSLSRLAEAAPDLLPAERILDLLLLPEGCPPQAEAVFLDRVAAAPPAGLASRVRAAAEAEDQAVASRSWPLLALADPAAALALLDAPLRVDEAKGWPQRQQMLVGLAHCMSPALVAAGRERLARWNQEEQAAADRWTGGKGFSAATPEVPMLDGDTLFARMAWLTYLARHDAAGFGAQFLRQHLLIGCYMSNGRESPGVYGSPRKDGGYQALWAAFAQLALAGRPVAEQLMRAQPGVAAEGLARARFTAELLPARNLLGGLDRVESAAILNNLASAAGNNDLADFAKARLAARETSP